MGGPGSGRTRRHTPAEECIRVDANFLVRLGALREGVVAKGKLFWADNRGEVTDEGWFVACKDQRVAGLQVGESVVEVLLLSSTPGFGGRRMYFQCPDCGRRARILYVVDGQWACRLCHGLTYQSCQASHRYDGLFRYMGDRMGYNVEEIRRAFRRRRPES